MIARALSAQFISSGRRCAFALGAGVLGVVVLATADPDLAQAALARAADKEDTARGGAGGRAGGGFADLFEFLDTLATYLIYLGAAFGALGIIKAGVEFQSGSPSAARTLGGTVVGLALVLLAKGITL